MGDCASHPHFAKIKAHELYSISVNDPYFHYNLPILVPSDADANESKLKSRLSYLDDKLKRLELCAHKAKLVIEIRKGVCIPSRLTDCFTESKTLVKVTTKPKERVFFTSYSSSYLPKWYNVFHFSFDPVEVPIDGISMELLECTEDTQQVVGTVQVDLREFSGVKIQNHELKLEQPYGDVRAIIEARLMFVRDRYKYWAEVKNNLQELLNAEPNRSTV